MQEATLDLTPLILGIVLGFLIGYFLMRLMSYRERQHIRDQAVRGSRNSIFGEVYEKVLPILPNFPYQPKDMVFVGKGVDYIVFDGLATGELREITFLEVKSGKSRLNANERQIRSAIESGRFRYREYRIDAEKER